MSHTNNLIREFKLENLGFKQKDKVFFYEDISFTLSDFNKLSEEDFEKQLSILSVCIEDRKRLHKIKLEKQLKELKTI